MLRRSAGMVFLAWAYVLSNQALGRQFQVATSESLSFAGRLYPNNDIFTSYMALPIALKHFNERNASILPILGNLGECDATLNLVDGFLFDDRGLPSYAMDHTIRLLAAKKIDFIHGPTTSDIAQTLAVPAGVMNVPLMSYLSTSNSLSDKVSYPTMFRIIATDRELAFATASVFERLGYRQVGLIHSNELYGTSFRDILTDSCAARNISVWSAGYSGTTKGSALEEEMRRAMESIKSLRLNVVFRVTVTIEQELLFARVAKKVDWITNKLHMNRLTIQSRDILRIAGDDLDAYSQLLKGSLTIVSTYDQNNPLYINLLNAWPTFDADFVNRFLPNGTTSIGQSYKIPPNFFNTSVAMFRSITTAYDSMIALGLAACGPSKNLTDNLRNVQFWGTSGFVSFTDRLNRAMADSGLGLSLQNYPGTQVITATQVEQVEIAYFSLGDWVMDGTIIYQDGTSNLPPDIFRSPPSIEQLPFGAKVAGWVEASIGVITGLWCLSQMHILSFPGNTPYRMQPSQYTLLALGAICVALAIIPLTFESDTGCMLFFWFFSLGIGLCFSVLAARAILTLYQWRVIEATKKAARKAAAARSSVPEESDPAFGTTPDTKTTTNVEDYMFRGLRIRTILLKVLLLIILVIILTCFQTISPEVFGQIVTETDGDGYPLTIVVTCSDSGPQSVPILVTLAVFLALLAAFNFVVSLRVRNAPEQFKDVQMSAVAALCIFQLFLIALPTSITVWHTALPRFLVLASTSFLVCMAVIITIFVPKILEWRSQARVNSKITAKESRTFEQNLSLGKEKETRNFEDTSGSSDEPKQPLGLNEGPLCGSVMSPPLDISFYPYSTTSHDIALKPGESSVQGAIDLPLQSRVLPSFVDAQQLRQSSTITPLIGPLTTSVHTNNYNPTAQPITESLWNGTGVGPHLPSESSTRHASNYSEEGDSDARESRSAGVASPVRIMAHQVVRRFPGFVDASSLTAEHFTSRSTQHLAEGRVPTKVNLPSAKENVEKLTQDQLSLV